MSEISQEVHFNLNEWFVLFANIAGFLLVLWLPKRFSSKTTGVFLLCGVFFGFLFDHTLSVFPVSFYRINDTSWFEVMDFFSHVMYAPYSYLFFYLYDKFSIRRSASLLYILVWAAISAGFEWLCETIGIFHYQHGYNLYYSFVIYLLVISCWVFLYRFIMAYGDKSF